MCNSASREYMGTMLGLVLFLSFVACARGFRIVCYYTNTAQYRLSSGRFLPEDIMPNQCTHIVYAYASPLGLGMGATDPKDITTPEVTGMYARVMKIKEKDPDVKVMLALASTDSESQPYIPVLSTAVSRSAFAQNAIVYLRKFQFDGLDVSWRYPSIKGKPVLNREKFALFFKELRDTFTVDGIMRNKPSLLLSAVLPGMKDEIESSYDIRRIVQYTDFVSLVTYDYNIGMDNTVRLSVPFHSHQDDPYSLESSTRYFMDLEIPKEKLNIGIALYGVSYTLERTNSYKLGAKARGPGAAGPFTKTEGQLAYYEVCEIITSGGRVFDEPSQDNRYLVKGDMWVSFEDVRSVITKICYAQDYEFGGVMVRSLDIDDFTGEMCGQGKSPLITAMANVIRDSTCRKYVASAHQHSGQSEIMKKTPGWRLLILGLPLLRLMFNCHLY